MYLLMLIAFYGVMSQALRDQASRHLKKGISQLNKGLYKDALDSLNNAERIAHKAKDLDILYTILDTSGRVLRFSGEYEKAKQSYEVSLQILEKLIDVSPDNILYQFNNAGILNNLGVLLMDMGRYEEAGQRIEKSLILEEKFLERYPGNISYQSDVAMTLNNLGAFLGNVGRLEEAKQRYESALQMREKLLERYPDNISYQSNVDIDPLIY